MSYKDYIKEGRNKWDMFSLKQTESRWSFKNLNTGQRYFVKLGEKNYIGKIQQFLTDIQATSSEGRKTTGEIDFHAFAQNVVKNGGINQFYVKSGRWNDIKSTWVIK